MFAALYRLVPGVLYALKILKPETVIRWHRAGCRAYWRWKSRSRGGRPKTLLEVRQLIRDMSIENPLWGAPQVHGELLKLGIASPCALRLQASFAKLCPKKNPAATPRTLPRIVSTSLLKSILGRPAIKRPKGSRNKLTERFLDTIADDFAEHGAEAIAKVRTDDPATYLKIVGSLVPRELIMQREQAPPINSTVITDDEGQTALS